MSIVGVLLIIAFSFGDILGLGGTDQGIGSLASASLLEAAPTPYDGETYIGFSRFTAAHLNATRSGPSRRLTFIDGEDPSTGPSIVSVDAGRRDQWAAAARSAQDNACYLILVTVDPQSDDGTTTFGRLSHDTPCLASAAFEHATKEDWDL